MPAEFELLGNDFGTENTIIHRMKLFAMPSYNFKAPLFNCLPKQRSQISRVVKVRYLVCQYRNVWAQ